MTLSVGMYINEEPNYIVYGDVINEEPNYIVYGDVYK